MIASLLVLALPQVSSTLELDVRDTLMTTSTQTPAIEYQGIVPGHPLQFVMTGPPSQVVFLWASLDAGASIPLGSGTLEIDALSAVMLGTRILDRNGEATVDLTTTTSLPTDALLRSQAITVDPASLAVNPSNSLLHRTVDLEVDVLASGNASQHPLKQTGGVLVIEDQSSYDQFWAEHYSGIPFQTPPPVDFTRDVVVASFYGLVGTTGYQLVADRLIPGRGSLTVAQTLNAPGPGCGGGFSMEEPFVFLRVDRVAAAPLATNITQTVFGQPCP